MTSIDPTQPMGPQSGSLQTTGAPGTPANDANCLAPGTRMGEFEIIGLVGEGGFGIVYEAVDHQLERHVAIKEYMPSAMAMRTHDARVALRSERHAETFEAGLRSFVNEAKLLAQFDHPALVKVFRFWEANGTAYMAMPLYRGPTLRNALKTLDGRPSEEWLRKLLIPLLEALESLHDAHCYHRDIAPDNILILAGDRPVLLDFGAARRVIGDMTQALTVILKPGYAPVEQYADGPEMRQGPWTDVYALAAVIYYCISGKPPPPSVSRMMRDTMTPAREVGSGVYSDELLAAIDHALAVTIEARTPSIAQMRTELGLDVPWPGRPASEATSLRSSTPTVPPTVPPTATPPEAIPDPSTVLLPEPTSSTAPRMAAAPPPESTDVPDFDVTVFQARTQTGSPPRSEAPPRSPPPHQPPNQPSESTPRATSAPEAAGPVPTASEGSASPRSPSAHSPSARSISAKRALPTVPILLAVALTVAGLSIWLLSSQTGEESPAPSDIAQATRAPEAPAAPQRQPETATDAIAPPSADSPARAEIARAPTPSPYLTPEAAPEPPSQPPPRPTPRATPETPPEPTPAADSPPIAAASPALRAPAEDAPAAPVAVPEPFTAMQALDAVYAGRDADWAVAVRTDKQAIQIGRDEFSFGVRSNRSGHLYLLMLGTDSEHFHLLFPNALDDNNRVQANVELQLPRRNWAIVAGGPPGTNRLIALVSQTRRNFVPVGLGKVDPFGEFDLQKVEHAYLERGPVAMSGEAVGCRSASADCARYGAARFEIREHE